MANDTHTQPWGKTEKRQWLARASIKRSYHEEVVLPLQTAVKAHTKPIRCMQYGALSQDTVRYPLFMLELKTTSTSPKPWVFITGGVHGYETSGVQGALDFVKQRAAHYQAHFNLLIAPCISPWGYETINRWNAKAIDPNRSFYANSPCEESAFLFDVMQQANLDILMHIDLHETTDTDNSVFRPELAQRDATPLEHSEIPDGFYLVADSDNITPTFQQTIIEAVSQVTPIADADNNGNIIGSKVLQPGVIAYPVKSLGLCAGLTHASYTTTTEVYPDSERVSPEDCNAAQVTSVCAALNYLLDRPINTFK